MIATITLNPSLDIAITVHSLMMGDSDKFTREVKKRRIQAIKQRCVSCGKPGKDNKNGTLFFDKEL